MSEHSQSSPTPERRAKRSGGSRRARGEGGGPRTKTGFRQNYVDFLAWMIAVFWAAGVVLDFVSKDYEPPAVLHGLMSLVATVAFGSTMLRRNGDD